MPTYVLPSFKPLVESIFRKYPNLEDWVDEQEKHTIEGTLTTEVRCHTSPSTTQAELFDWDYATSTALSSEASSKELAEDLAVPSREYWLSFSFQLVASFERVPFEDLCVLLQLSGDKRNGHLSNYDFIVGSKKALQMASSEVDMKFLGQFAANIQGDHPLLARSLFQIFGNLTMLSEKVIRARKLRRYDTTRDTKSVRLYSTIIWYSREGLKLLEQCVLPMVANYGELKVLAYKLRASFYHLYVLFHNQPQVSLKSGQISTPPGLKSPRALKTDKGKGVDRGSPSEINRPNSVQLTHPLEGGPVGGVPEVAHPPPEFAPNFLVPAEDYRPQALKCFQEATALAEGLLWGSHPLRLSVKVEYTAFLYDCLHERDRSRHLAKATIAEVYNAQEGMDDEMFEDAAQLVGILGKMMKRGLGSAGSGSTPGAGSSGARTTPPRRRAEETQFAVPSPGMDNAI